MTKETKINILQIVGGITVFIGLIVVIALATDDSQEVNNDFSKFLKQTNFPINSYFIDEEKAEKERKSIYSERYTDPKEDKKKGEDEKDSFKAQAEKLKEELKAKKNSFTSNIFEDEEEIKKRAIAKKREQILNELYSSNGITVQEKEALEIREKRDYGDSSFSNYDKRAEASNQTKLYRSITADNIIPMILINNIDTSLDGKVIAQVESDIYSSMGQTLLIPKGTKAIGYYQRGNELGANRFPLFWERMITPTGNLIYFNEDTAMSNDIAGNSGVLGIPDDRYWERYGIPLSLSTVSNAFLLAISKINDKGTPDSQIIMDSSRQDLNYIMKKIINEQVKIQPKNTVPAGTKIFLSARQDIWFPEPKDGEIQIKYFKKYKSFIKENKK